MKTIFWIGVILFSLSGCSSYCNFKESLSAFDTIFIAQCKKGAKETSKNWKDIKQFVSDDFKKAGKRLYDNLETLYRPVDFEGASDRMDFYGTILGRQIEDGLEQTGKNFKSIANYLCICKD